MLEHAWKSEGINGEWRCLICDQSGGTGTAPFYFGPCISEDGIHPKVMPVEEVEKMLKEIMVNMISSCIKISEGGLPEPPAMDIRAIASKYNLNP